MTTCDACGFHGPTVRHTYVHTTNGGLTLCKTCLNDVNRKSPLLIAAQQRIMELEAGVRKINDNLRAWEGFWQWKII